MKKSYILLLVAVIASFYAGIFTSSRNVIVETCNYNSTLVSLSPIRERSISVPAVGENGEGISTTLRVEVKKGKGRVLTNIDKLLYWVDVQNSIRTARHVAENYTGVNLSTYDMVYTIETDATSVEGPSAGAALTLITIAALTGKKINESVTITGAINHDGSIGPVSNVEEKAIVAKKEGKKLFLVPLNQGVQKTYRNRKYCEKVGSSEICTTERVPEVIDVEEKVGIKVLEVKDIKEAMKYVFLEHST